MPSKRQFEPHLALTKGVLAPAGEWTVQPEGWCFLFISSGVAYWLHPRCNHELSPGSALLISERASGVVRASQVGEVLFHYSRLIPSRLIGLISWGEQMAFERAAGQESSTIRAFNATDPMAERFRMICAKQSSPGLATRLKLLDLFLSALGESLVETQVQEEVSPDARLRLLKLLQETPAADLLELSFQELVRQVCCTPRHLTRIFHEIAGMSFREKQAELRLTRAQELLATTQTKVVHVALESGYRSLSLFNLSFKRRFGITPAKWRDRNRPDEFVQPRKRLSTRKSLRWPTPGGLGTG